MMRVLVLFGGESVEHEISIITASQIMNALSVHYTVIPLYISKENKLYCSEEFKDLNSFKGIENKLKKSKEVCICKEKIYERRYPRIRKSRYIDWIERSARKWLNRVHGWHVWQNY